jgi:hypothetical protein
MDWFQGAAVLGALAWVPQVVGWIYRALAKPIVTFVTDRQAEVGFSFFGPILNLTVAINSERKGVILNDLRIRVTHESGDTRFFQWQGLVDRLGTMTAQGTPMPFEKDQNAVAVKIAAGELVERLVRFREMDTVETQTKLLTSVAERANKLQATDPTSMFEIVYWSQMRCTGWYRPSNTRTFGSRASTLASWSRAL